MDILTVVLVLGLLAGVVFYFRSRQSARDTSQEQDRLSTGGRALQPAPDRKTVTIENLHAGDALVFWDGGDAIAEAVLDCTEQVGTRTVSWQWILLDNDWVIEVSPDGRFLYKASNTYPQGSWEFDHLTGDAEQGGVLRAFEESVRTGAAAREPAYFQVGEGMYQVRNTGVFSAVERDGTEIQRPVWRDISPDASDNVYAGFSTSGDEHALAVWTTHLVFLRGRELHDADLRGLYGK